MQQVGIINPSSLILLPSHPHTSCSGHAVTVASIHHSSYINGTKFTQMQRSVRSNNFLLVSNLNSQDLRTKKKQLDATCSAIFPAHS